MKSKYNNIIPSHNNIFPISSHEYTIYTTQGSSGGHSRSKLIDSPTIYRGTVKQGTPSAKI